MPPKSFENVQNNLDPIKVPGSKQDAITPEKTGDRVSSNTLKTIRTYASDMADAVREKQGSVVKIAMAEEKKRQDEVELKNPVSKRNIFFVIGAIILIGGAAGALYFGVLAKKAPVIVLPQDMPKQSISLIATDEEVPLPAFDKKNFEAGMKTLIESTHTLGAITILAPETLTENTTAGQFVSLLGFHFSPQLVRSLSPQFSLGIYTFDGNIPFLILRSDSYDAAYIGLLSAEKTLYDDFDTLFALPADEGDGISFFTKPFLDDVIANKDVRVVNNVAGEHVFLYGILDDGTIIFTTDDETFKKLVLSAS